ncbi:YqgE/AlgH family protein [Nocardioides sp. zg-DK7169]|uniref:YqgE/AlgH family protein n=1 Tax=Nocardioides sp. zg-DK7169 TaxID=2736600 RepID=UPI001551AB86|nr:YqgE/AlgH family protein [Nocardioides sp. zg-DK7169]NPC97566.1 YqgE/AlgH family protein [Nocardioides sp. zg-DK7169]
MAADRGGLGTRPGAGMLLVASPELIDPNFAETVVLLLDVDPEGALGVVLNRPSPVPVADVLPEWSAAVAEPELLFEGGPVGPDGALALALSEGAADDQPVGFQPVLGDLGMVDLDAPVELVRDQLRELRIFAGYAGWGAAQLAEEIAEGSWYVVPAHADDIFRVDPTQLWRDVLRRQPGELAWVSTRPIDAGLN